MADLLVNLGMRRSLVHQQFDDMFVPLPRGQVERVAALVVGDVGEGLVTQQHLHHLAAGQKTAVTLSTLINRHGNSQSIAGAVPVGQSSVGQSSVGQRVQQEGAAIQTCGH